MARRSVWLRAGLLATLALGLEGCATGGAWLSGRLPDSPHAQYVDALERNGLDTTPEAQAWLAAATASLARPRDVDPPRHVTGTATPGTGPASALRFAVAEGRRLALDLRPAASSPGQVFVDVFEVAEDALDAGDAARVASLAPDALTIALDVRRDTTFVVRVQPSLEWAGSYVLTARTLASLPFPVQGLTPRAVQSGFGAEREAGRRRHEGIDIFASRGTPVVAVVSGIAQPATNGLGGLVVWLHEPDARRTFYYAHLDRQAFDVPRRVVPGDVLGYVGNTGNARTTAPHLHFGIYDDGPRDPLPYVQADDVVPPLPASPAIATQ